MIETELDKAMLREVRQLLADLEAGHKPANPAIECAVRAQVVERLAFAKRLVDEMRRDYVEDH